MVKEAQLELARAGNVEIETAKDIDSFEAPTRKELEAVNAPSPQGKGKKGKGKGKTKLPSTAARKSTVKELREERRTVTGLDASAQLSILELLDEAIADFDFED